MTILEELDTWLKADPGNRSIELKVKSHTDEPSGFRYHATVRTRSIVGGSAASSLEDVIRRAMETWAPAQKEQP